MRENARLKPESPLSGSLLKDWLLTDLTEARRELEAPEHGLDRAIHLARRRMKRVRTLFLVVKSVAGASHENRARPVKEAFQQLSGPRDADAMLKAANWLNTRAGSKSRQATLALVDQLKIHVASLHRQQVPIADVVRLLRIAETEAASLAVEPDSFDLLRDRLTKTYGKGRKLYHSALDPRENDDETLHDWRKQVKHRLHISQIIEGTGLHEPSFPLKDLDRLAEYLGEEHDFANLIAWIGSDAFKADASDVALLVAAIGRRRAKLTSRALELGAELYGQKTSSFAKELRMGA